jgi:glycosyltransferase involved in cell wall biosynthesis
MKLVLFTDNLGSGGAQNQLCLLASELLRLGHDVSMLTYNLGTGDDANFFGQFLDSRGIARHRLPSVQRWRRPVELRRAVARLEPDAVLAFQEASSLYAELAGLGGRGWGLVVSERNAFPGSQKGLRQLARLFHEIADEVTTNSKANRELMARSWQRLGSRVHVVYNAVDLEHFRPGPESQVTSEPHDHRLRLVVLARYEGQKNIQNVLEAILCLRGRIGVRLRWYGGTRGDGSHLDRARDFVRANGLQAEVELLPPTCDPRQAYWDSDAVLLASWYEGCPNAVCEAMACGKPVLASAVADNALLVEDGISGLLFDPQSPVAIAESIERFSELPPERRREMGIVGRRRAESLFCPESCVHRYEELLVSAARRRGGDL